MREPTLHLKPSTHVMADTEPTLLLCALASLPLRIDAKS